MSPLTPAQLAALKTAIQADSAFNNETHNSDGASDVAAAFNLADISNTSVWWSATPVDNILNSITWARYTPNDAIPTDTQVNVAVWTARCLAAQTKQMNLQNMLVGRQVMNAALVTTRSGLDDAVTNVPTGNGGANAQPGGSNAVNTLTACLRPTKATRAEKLFSAGASTTGTVTADILTFEGQLQPSDVQAAMGWW